MTRRRIGIIAVIVVPVLIIAGVGAFALTSHNAPRHHHHAAFVYTAPKPGTPVHAALTATVPRIGVFEPGTPQSYAPVAQFAKAAGVRPRIVLYYSGWWQPFAAKFADQARAAGAIPLVQMIPYGHGVTVRQVAAGAYDGYLRTFAEQVRKFGHPVIISFAPEPNGRWYYWGWTKMAAPVWVAAWRHVVSEFHQQGALNVTWLWTVSHTVRNTGHIGAWWPGAAYVNWVGIDGYYAVHQTTFDRLFAATIKSARKLTHDPILLAETAVGRTYASPVVPKIGNLFAGAKAQHVAGVVWFDKTQSGGVAHQDWRLEGHPSALAAFRRGAAQLLAKG